MESVDGWMAHLHVGTMKWHASTTDRTQFPTLIPGLDSRTPFLCIYKAKNRGPLIGVASVPSSPPFSFNPGPLFAPWPSTRSAANPGLTADAEFGKERNNTDGLTTSTVPKWIDQ